MSNYLVIKKKDLLNERTGREPWETALENILMVVGFVPVLGEIADIILIIYYCIKKEWIYALLMLVALIPTVGDIVAKPFIKVLRGLTGRQGRMVRGNVDDFAEYLSKNPEMKKKFDDIIQHLDNPKLKKVLDDLFQIKQTKKYSSGLQRVLDSLKRRFTSPITTTGGIGKSIGRQFAMGSKRPIAKGITNYFKEESLAKYILKNGQEPSNFIKKWYINVYKPYYNRRLWVKNFIGVNHILDFLGLPSYNSFVHKLETDEDFRTYVANQPWASQMIGETTTPDDLNNLMKKDETDTGGLQALLTSALGLGMLKAIAKRVV